MFETKRPVLPHRFAAINLALAGGVFNKCSPSLGTRGLELCQVRAKLQDAGGCGGIPIYFSSGVTFPFRPVLEERLARGCFRCCLRFFPQKHIGNAQPHETIGPPKSATPSIAPEDHPIYSTGKGPAVAHKPDSSTRPQTLASRSGKLLYIIRSMYSVQYIHLPIHYISFVTKTLAQRSQDVKFRHAARTDDAGAESALAAPVIGGASV